METPLMTLSGIAIEPGEWQEPPLFLPDGTRDKEGRLNCFRIVMTVRRSPNKEVFHWWYGQDQTVLSPSGRVMPHDHPFGSGEFGSPSFTSKVLKGWIQENRYWVEGGLVHQQRIVHEEGDTYVMPCGYFHHVSACSHGAVTHMVCEPSRQTQWGYLDLDTLEILPPMQSELYAEMIKELNPHKR
jgi:hypothetical protein